MLLALHTNPQLRVDELGPPEFKSNERFEKAQTVTVTFPAPAHAYDVRYGKALGPQSSLRLTIDPYEPAVIALSPVPLPRLQVTAPASVARGDTATVGLRFETAAPAGQHVFRVECLDPSGKPVSHYSANVLASRGIGSHPIPFALTDAAGQWTVRVTDLLSGQTEVVKFNVP